VVIYLEAPDLIPVALPELRSSRRTGSSSQRSWWSTVGSTVSFPNEDPIFHNVFSLSKVKRFDLVSYPAGETRDVRFDRPGVVQVFCHLHTDMSATILVLPTTSWTLPAARWQLCIVRGSAWLYELVAWHRSAGLFRRHVTVGGGKAPAVDFVIPVKELDSGVMPK